MYISTIKSKHSTGSYGVRVCNKQKDPSAYVGNEGNGNACVGLYESDEHLRSDVDQ